MNGITDGDETARPNLKPRLPLELEREIFEIAAFGDRGSVPRLVLVAQRVNEWYSMGSATLKFMSSRDARSLIQD